MTFLGGGQGPGRAHRFVPEVDVSASWTRAAAPEHAHGSALVLPYEVLDSWPGTTARAGVDHDGGRTCKTPRRANNRGLWLPSSSARPSPRAACLDVHVRAGRTGCRRLRSSERRPAQAAVVRIDAVFLQIRPPSWSTPALPCTGPRGPALVGQDEGASRARVWRRSRVSTKPEIANFRNEPMSSTGPGPRENVMCGAIQPCPGP